MHSTDFSYTQLQVLSPFSCQLLLIFSLGPGCCPITHLLHVPWLLPLQALKIQLELDQHNKTLETARKQYERARAVHYTNPTDTTLQVMPSTSAVQHWQANLFHRHPTHATLPSMGYCR